MSALAEGTGDSQPTEGDRCPKVRPGCSACSPSWQLVPAQQPVLYPVSSPGYVQKGGLGRPMSLRTPSPVVLPAALSWGGRWAVHTALHSVMVGPRGAGQTLSQLSVSCLTQYRAPKSVGRWLKGGDAPTCPDVCWTGGQLQAALGTLLGGSTNPHLSAVTWGRPWCSRGL